MSALAHISRVLAVFFALIAGFWIALPFLNLLSGTYQGGEMFFIAIVFGGFFAVVAVLLYGCYRYARPERDSSAIRGFVWCFVALAGLAAFAFVTRIIWIAVIGFTR
jgi:hypothetical protein